METERIVILGGGFGRIAVAQALRRAPVQVTLVQKDEGGTRTAAE